MLLLANSIQVKHLPPNSVAHLQNRIQSHGCSTGLACLSILRLKLFWPADQQQCMATIKWNLPHTTHVIFSGRAFGKCLREIPAQLNASGKAVGPAESATQPTDKDRCSTPDPAAPGAAAMDGRLCVCLAHRTSAFVQWFPLKLRQSAGNTQRDAAQPHLWRLFRAPGELVWLLYIAQAQVYSPSINVNVDQYWVSQQVSLPASCKQQSVAF